MDAGLLVAYIALWLAFIGLIIGALAVKRHRKLLIILVAIAGVLLLAGTYLIRGPLLTAVKNGIEMPEGVVVENETSEETGDVVTAEPENVEAWGPKDRAMYTTADSIDHVVFNSITDNSSLGHETNFVRIREAGVGTFTDNVDLTVGKEYEVFVYYHNDGSVTARDVRIKMNFPTKLETGETGELKGGISSTNADPMSVFDTAFLHTDSTVYLTYVPESAVLHNNGSGDGIIDSEDLFSVGAEITHDTLGDIPGGAEGYLVFRIKVDQPGWFTESEVSADGENWEEIISAKTGDVLHFRVRYTNTGTTEQTAVTVHDDLGDGLELIPGTVVVYVNDKDGVSVSDSIIDKGLNIGDYEPGESAVVEYQVKVGEVAAGAILYNNVWLVTENGTQYDKCKITVE